ncbi:class I SAM-dependent methyltransferase [Leucothrix pacifica]|uniref:SAM-dependent methyltransferase n=1 Tax=Leucothrix pacifica TaxID=1247513 RepID=A0A317CQI0_9GAMM|nr:class I SAM-dependent methyltransferase [Leucothrix pacifica]PWQ99783.1 SAM-dependent methyltransferase [Leucothrix pacifica]
MLLERNQVIELLRCPKHQTPLTIDGQNLISHTENPALSSKYEFVDHYPIVIDFDKSILNKKDTEGTASVINRPAYEGLSGIIKRVLLPRSKATKDNVELLFSELLKKHAKPRVLMVGGGTPGQSMEPFYEDPRIELVSFDIYASDSVQFVADAHDIPLPDNAFDGVIIQAVLEHVLDPEKVVSEIYRVLKDDGIVYAETPFLQHVHEGAYDFTRYTESGHRFLFKNFELIKSGTTAGAGTQLLWAIEYFSRGIFRSRNIGKIFKLLFFWLQYLDSLIPESYNIDAASGVFFAGRKQSKSISDEAIVSHYGGAQ